MARLLLIEHDARVANFLRRALAAEGLVVDVVADGHRALGIATSGHYDLVLLDLVLPDHAGLLVLEGIIAARPAQRVLVLSGRSEPEERSRCLELGAVDYVAKPFALPELTARIRARLREPSPARVVRFLQAGRLTLDVLKRTASGTNGPVNLSQREFLLLEALMRKHGQICSREELLASVWGSSFDPGTNVVNVYIARLRAKLGSEVIETVRNVGFCLQT